MRVTLVHDGETVTSVEPEMDRWPWTTCRGAIAQLEATFSGQRLGNFPRRGEKTRNCTHLHDLALFAAGHAMTNDTTAYDVSVSDPVAGKREAILVRNGEPLLHWSLAGDRLTAPAELAGRTLGELGDWFAAQDEVMREAGRILRWAAIMALGRGMDIPAGLSATSFPPGACFTFQPDVAATATRRPGAHVDFSAKSNGPLARHSHFLGKAQEPL